MADVVDAMTKSCNSRCRITTLTVYIQLRIVSVRVEVYVVLVSHFFKVRRVESITQTVLLITLEKLPTFGYNCLDIFRGLRVYKTISRKVTTI